MNASKIVIAISVILILIQLLSIIGMSNVRVGLYPDNSDLLYGYYSSEESVLNSKIITFAIQAGADRFQSSFGDFAYDKYDYENYRVMTVDQITSAIIRESLNKSDLAVYDTILTISYAFVGIVGIILLIFTTVVHFINKFNIEKVSRSRYLFLKKAGFPEEVISTCGYYENCNAPLISYLDSCIKRGLISIEQKDVLFNYFKAK